MLDDVDNELKVEFYKSTEPAYVDQVRVIGPAPLQGGTTPLQRISIKLRVNRNPVIGDKFSSRHGQKVLLSPSPSPSPSPLNLLS